ncbi:MAG: elongation factor G [Ignavibacteriae bacterium]|nr:elongation factor G [Ignavibacteriota bacterium]MCB9215134.1 elongation factor G [Ignavibacteria bacterium]
MAAEFESGAIRNVVLAGHGGAGKTTLAEAMLFAAGETNRMGSVEDGSTVSDYHKDEIDRQHSLVLSMLHAKWKGHKLNILDGPGYPDFIGDMKSAVRVADTMVMAVDASAGVGFGADSAWSFAEESRIPVLFTLTKVATEHAHLEETLDYLREHFSRDIVPLEYPVYKDKALAGMVNILSMQYMTFSIDGSGKHTDSGDIPDEVKARCLELREGLVETLAESSEELMNEFFENGTLTDEQIKTGLKAALLQRRIFPLFAVSSTKNVGVTPLMDFLVEYCPSPLDLPAPHVAKDGVEGGVELPKTSDGSPILFVFKTVSEHHVGELSFFRVYGGKVASGTDLVNAQNGTAERVNQIYTTNGSKRKEATELVFGDIGAVVKLKNTHTNNTLAPKGKEVVIPTIIFPGPITDAAVVMKGKGDEAKVSEGLHTMHEEDPTFNVYQDPESHETVVSGLGEMHLEVIIKRLQDRYGIEVEMKPPRIPYRETIRKSATTSYRHKKQTGGAGQFGEVHCFVGPYDENIPVPSQYNVRGEEFEELSWGGKLHFVNAIVGGAIEARFIPAVKKGVLEMLGRGVYAGYPITNVRVVLYDGKMHPVDSNENAFKTAGRMCFREGFNMCNPKLMEPIWDLEIAAPADYMGEIMGDLSSRRGRIMGMDAKGSTQIIKAQVPLGELYGYAARLRSLTQGRGSYTRNFSHYEEVPGDVEQKIVKSAELEEIED